jgi:glycosyltransferase-like protein
VDQPLRIALLTYSTRPRGGVVHTLALAEALAAAGEHVTVWTLARGGDTGFFRPVDPAVQVRAVPFPDPQAGTEETLGERVGRSIALLGQAFAAAVADGAEYDVVHAQDCISANAVPGRVRTVHHLDHFTTPQLVACHERALREPVAHVCVSASVAGELSAGWGIDATVVPNGVDAARFAAAAGGAAAAVARHRWRAQLGQYVLAVGGIEPRKGTLELVEAMALVQVQRPETQLVIAGGETLFDYRDYRRQVDELAARLGVGLVMLGPVAHDALPSLVAAADVFAFPSVQEGFGLAAMEALAAQVPVVVRELPVLREIFAGAVRFAGTPEDLAAQIVAVLDEPMNDEEARRRGAAGQALAAAHTWSAAAAAHRQLYRGLIRSGAAVGSRGGAQ